MEIKDQTFNMQQFDNIHNYMYDRCIFTDCDFQGKIFRSSFTDCIFIRCKFFKISETIFDWCTIHGCTFSHDLFDIAFNKCSIVSNTFDCDLIDTSIVDQCRLVNNTFCNCIKFIDIDIDTCSISTNKGIFIATINGSTIIIGKQYTMISDMTFNNNAIDNANIPDYIKALVKTFVNSTD